MNTKKIKILVIEDDTVLGDVLIEKLGLSGYETQLSLNGEDGLSQVKSFKPDLILLDIVLPKKDGYEVLDELEKVYGKGNFPPVIIISNSGQVAEIDHILRLGVKDYLIKADFSPDEAIKKVEQVLNINKKNQDVLSNESTKVLIIEDDDFIRELILTKLKQRNCDVDVAISGKEAIELIMQTQYSAILLDLIMPDEDGFEVLEKCRSDSLNIKTPIIVFSNLSLEKEIERATKLGATDFLLKSNFNLDEVLNRLGEHIIKHKKNTDKT